MPAKPATTAVEGRPNQALVWTLIGLLGITWVGVNASWGLTDPGNTLVSGRLQQVAPLHVWLLASLALIGGTTAASAWRRRRAATLVGSVLLAYLAGVWVAGIADGHLVLAGPVAVVRFVERSLQLLPAIPMLVVWMALHGMPPTLAWGTWRGRSQISPVFGRELTWRRLLIAWITVIALPATVVMQAQVRFAPLLSGAIWTGLGPLAALAFLNGFIEEILFRGLLQASLVAAIGPTAGIWLQATFFGIHHWGASPGAAAAFPMALLTAGLAVLWGHSVLETGGLGWAICSHASLDLGFFLVQFVHKLS